MFKAREMIAVYLSEGILLHFCASMISGLVTTIASMPVDIIKTKWVNFFILNVIIIETYTIEPN